MKFKEQLITVHTRHDISLQDWDIPVKAMCASGLAYHLGIHKEVKHLYVVTHIQSGLQIGGPISADENYTRRWVEHLATLTNWHKPAADVLNSGITSELITSERDKFEHPIEQQSLWQYER